MILFMILFVYLLDDFESLQELWEYWTFLESGVYFNVSGPVGKCLLGKW